MEIAVKLNLNRYFRLRTNTLGQLKKEIPCCNISHISSCNHREKRTQIVRHINRCHVKRENIVNIHRLISINDMITIRLVLTVEDKFSIRDISYPCQTSVSARTIIKIKNRLILAIHGNFNRSFN